MGYSIEAITSDCYDGTTCLINKLDIRDERVLAQVEADITFAKATELEEKTISHSFDFEHYKAIHRYLFEDLYDWAGEIRCVDIAKKGTNFAKATEINTMAEHCFARLKADNYFQNQDFEDFVDNIVDFYCVTNMLHPFREGNGRTQRAFIAQLIRFCGYDINFADIDPDELMVATIQSANGVITFLKAIFHEHIHMVL